MSSENSIDLSIGTIITMENIGVTTQPIDIVSLEFEDIFLSNCEEYWLAQFDEDGRSTITSPNGTETTSQTSSASFLSENETTSQTSSASFSFENETTSQTNSSLFSTVNGFVIVKNASPNGTQDFSDEATLPTDVVAARLNEPITTENELPDQANMGCFEPTECMDVEEPTEHYVSATISEHNEKSTEIASKIVTRIGIEAEIARIKNVTPINLEAKTKGSCDNSNMFVRPVSDQTVKKLCCPFCLKCVSKLPRHLAAKHSTEPDVKKFMKLPKRSEERRSVQDSLRKLGLYKWNTDAKLNGNELIPSRRPSGDVVQDATKWTTCPYCLGPYTKNNLRHHVADYHNKPNKDQRTLNKLATIAEGRIHESASARLVTIMGFMRQDLVVKLIKYDWVLIVFGNKMCCKYTPHYQHNMIRARLRLMGRVLLEMKQIDKNVTDFASIYHVERYQSMVAAIKLIGRFNPDTNEFGAPAMASFAVTFMRQIGKYVSAEYIRLRDRENKVEAEDFLAYMDTDIHISINKLVTDTQARMRRQKQQNIPTMEDVKKLIRFINTERNSCFEKLSHEYSDKNWLQLAELCMAWIIVFNRRRVGEVQNILLDEFVSRQSADSHDEGMFANLSDDSQQIARKFKRMKIRGKKGRTVPVLLKPAVENCIELLLSHRQAAGLSMDAQYLFELPSTSDLQVRVINACKVLRDLSVSCNATKPASLRGTNLRKHMATTCLSLELSDALVAELAKFMGHAEKIHKDCYQHNPIEREVVQMAQLLETAAGKCDSDDEDDDDNASEEYGVVVGRMANGSSTNKSVEVPDAEPEGTMMLDDDADLHIQQDAGGDSRNVKKKCARIPWTQEDILCVRQAFPTHFRNRTSPNEKEIVERLRDESFKVLRARTWQQIKAYVNNQKNKRN